jgi:predicted O-methyltransferase YrrM
MAMEQGMSALLGTLVSVLQPKLVVEAGTYRGHGALSIAYTLRDIKYGHLHTADPIDQGFGALIAKHALEPYVTFHQATYEAMLEMVDGEGPIDLAFIDASGKASDGVMRMRHLLLTYDRLAVGGVIVMDDIAATDWPYVNVIRSMSQMYFPSMRGVALFQKRV